MKNIPIIPIDKLCEWVYDAISERRRHHEEQKDDVQLSDVSDAGVYNGGALLHVYVHVLISEGS